MLYDREDTKNSFAGSPCAGERAPLRMNTSYLLTMKNKPKKKLLRVAVASIIVVISAVAISNISKVSYTQNGDTPIIQKRDDSKLDAIRNREDIKKQQELLVQETYLSEEKTRMQAEKEQKIAEYDAQIADVETKLEEVRAQKLSF